MVFRLGRGRGRFFADLITPHMAVRDTVLDIGTGTGNVCAVLRERHYRVTPLDVEDLSFSDTVQPTIYDGVTMPYPANTFMVALLLTVLHHTPDPEAVLSEAARVARRVIIIEDIYDSTFHKYLTFFCDSLFNAEFRGHPHSNKSDSAWQMLFRQRGYKIVSVHYTRSFVVFKHAVYVLEC